MPKIVNHDKRRISIARAAAQVIAERGLEATKLSDIGRSAGVTTGAISHYFDDKDAVLLAALDIAYDLMFDNMSQVAKQADYSLFEILAEALPTTPKSRRAMAVWLAFWSRSIAEPVVARQQMTFHKRWLEKVKEELIKHYQRKGKNPPVELDELCEGVTAQINGLIIRGLVDAVEWPKQRLHKALRSYLQALDLE